MRREPLSAKKSASNRACLESVRASVGLAALLFLVSCAVVGCRIDSQTGKSALSIIGDGLVNDPANKSLRFDIVRFGLDEFCRELTALGAPLRLTDDQPVIGRFFATDCSSKPSSDPGKQTVLIKFGGRGYATTQATGRLGFEARALMELSPDFRLNGDSLYVYFRPVHVDTSSFDVKMTELPYAAAGAATLGLDEKEIGRAIISAQLHRGFTVIRYDSDGHADFALGLTPLGKKPFRPFSVTSTAKKTLANGRTELDEKAQDFLGKLTVTEDSSLFVHFKLEGTRAIDVLLLSAKDHPSLIQNFVETSGPYGKAGSSWSSVVSAQAPFKAELRVPPGDYFLAFDNSAALGLEAPDAQSASARVDYLVQVGPHESP